MGDENEGGYRAQEKKNRKGSSEDERDHRCECHDDHSAQREASKDSIHRRQECNEHEHQDRVEQHDPSDCRHNAATAAESELHRPDVADHHSHDASRDDPISRSVLHGQPNGNCSLDEIQTTRDHESPWAEDTADIACTGGSRSVISYISALEHPDEIVPGGQATEKVEGGEQQKVGGHAVDIGIVSI